MIRRDYLERLIEQVSAAVAKALGLARGSQHEEARAEIDSAYHELGFPHLVLDRLDAATIRMMAGDKLPALCRLVEADATIAQLAGDTLRADRRERLASALSSPPRPRG